MDNFYNSRNVPSFQSLESENLDEFVKPCFKLIDSEPSIYSNEYSSTTQLAYSGEIYNAETDSQIMDYEPITSLFACNSSTCK
jgi:hypothetical protein